MLFVDEIHHFNKAQQDNFLPHVERGTLTLIGATTENPSFEVISPLLSRCQVLVLKALSPAEIGTIVDRALHDPNRGLGSLRLEITAPGPVVSNRAVPGRLPGRAQRFGSSRRTPRKHKAKGDRACAFARGLAKTPLRYDKGGDEHYNVISAFIKSMRGSDPDAAVYWMMRMIEAGEDPLFIARRMVIFAAEDIGNAPIRKRCKSPSPPKTLSLHRTSRRTDSAGAGGDLPRQRAEIECDPHKAMLAAVEDVRQHGALPVPLHLRNAPTPLMQDLGCGKDYKYAHDYEDHFVEQERCAKGAARQTLLCPVEVGAGKANQGALKSGKKAKAQNTRDARDPILR